MVNVSSGPQEVAVPDVIGMTVQQATRELKAVGFKAQVETFGLFGGKGDRVWDYNPIGEAPRGSVILLDVMPGGRQLAAQICQAYLRRADFGSKELCQDEEFHAVCLLRIGLPSNAASRWKSSL